MLSVVERRMPVGKRDYAILLLLVTYGLRAREVAALLLDHIDWKRERLHVPERKADHATAYPLSTIVGDAIVDYLQYGRPKTTDCHLFSEASPLTCRSRFRRFHAALLIISARRGSQSRALARIRFATLACSGWSMPISRSK